MDWRDNGRRLFRRLNEDHRDWNWMAVMRVNSDCTTEDQLVGALIAIAKGDPSRLIEFLLSDKEVSLSREARELLGQILRRRPPGRPTDVDARQALLYAEHLYSLWKRDNKEMGISDWGHRDEMKDEACRYGIALCESEPYSHPPDFETVRELMRRPKSRKQKPPK